MHCVFQATPPRLGTAQERERDRESGYVSRYGDQPTIVLFLLVSLEAHPRLQATKKGFSNQKPGSTVGTCTTTTQIPQKEHGLPAKNTVIFESLYNKRFLEWRANCDQFPRKQLVSPSWHKMFFLGFPSTFSSFFLEKKRILLTCAFILAEEEHPLDPPLSDAGVQEAKDTAERIASFVESKGGEIQAGQPVNRSAPNFPRERLTCIRVSLEPKTGFYIFQPGSNFYLPCLGANIEV